MTQMLDITRVNSRMTFRKVEVNLFFLGLLVVPLMLSFHLMIRTKVSQTSMTLQNGHQLLHDIGLYKPSLSGRKFTWTNSQVDPIWVRLDHFLVSQDWLSLFRRVSQSTLPRSSLDHVPICFDSVHYVFYPCMFKFKKMWVTTEGFDELINKW